MRAPIEDNKNRGMGWKIAAGVLGALALGPLIAYGADKIERRRDLSREKNTWGDDTWTKFNLDHRGTIVGKK